MRVACNSSSQLLPDRRRRDGLARGGALGLFQDLGLDARDRGKLSTQPIEITLPGSRMPQGSSSSWTWPIVSAGAAAPPVFVVEPAITREGKDVAHTIGLHHDLFDLSHQRILFGERQVAARADIDDCVLRLGLDEEVHAGCCSGRNRRRPRRQRRRPRRSSPPA